MALDLQNLWAGSGLQTLVASSTSPGLRYKNGTIEFECKVLVQGDKTDRQMEKIHKRDASRQLFTTVTEALFRLAVATTPVFPTLPKLAIMHVYDKTLHELFKLLGLDVVFHNYKKYRLTGISAVIRAPLNSPVPRFQAYNMGNDRNSRGLLSKGCLEHRKDGPNFLNNVQSYLAQNPGLSPLAQYFPGQQAPIQQQPPQPSVNQATALTVAAPNPLANVGASQVNQAGLAAWAYPTWLQPPQLSGNQATSFNVAVPNPAANFGVSQVSQPAVAAVNHPAQHSQLPQSAGSQAVAVNSVAPNPAVNFGVPQVSQPYLAAVNHPASQMQLQQPDWNQAAKVTSAAPNADANFGDAQVDQADVADQMALEDRTRLALSQWKVSQAATVPSAASNAYASFGASQVNQPDQAAMAPAHQLALPQQGLSQAASFNSVAQNAPVNFGVGQLDQAAIMHPSQQMPAQQMPVPQPGLDQGNSLSPMQPDYGTDLPPMGPFAHVDGGVDGMNQAGPAPMEAPSAGMDQESLDFAAPPAYVDPRMLQGHGNAGMYLPSQDLETPLSVVNQGAPFNSQAFQPYVHQGADEVSDLPGLTATERYFQELPPDQRAMLHSEAASNTDGFSLDDLILLHAQVGVSWHGPGGSPTEQGAMPPQSQPLQATEVAPRDPNGLQELGSDQSFAQTSRFGSTDTSAPAFTDVGAELVDYEAYVRSS